MAPTTFVARMHAAPRELVNAAMSKMVAKVPGSQATAGEVVMCAAVC